LFKQKLQSRSSRRWSVASKSYKNSWSAERSKSNRRKRLPSEKRRLGRR
jgi:hypothetical protein